MSALTVKKCPSTYPPSATGPYSDGERPGWSGPLRCTLSKGHEGDRHLNTGIAWREVLTEHPVECACDDECLCPLSERGAS